MPPVQTIPASLSSLKNLKSLNLDGNRVRAIPPPVLADCAALHTLSLHGNPITIQARAGLLLNWLHCYWAGASPGGGSPGRMWPCLKASWGRCWLVQQRAWVSETSMRLLSNRRSRSPAAPAAQDVQATEGWAAFEARRKSKFDKSIGAGVLLDSKGLDEGVDMQRRRG